MSNYDQTVLQTMTMGKVIFLLNEILNTPRNTKKYNTLRKEAEILNGEYIRAIKFIVPFAEKQSELNRRKDRD